MSITISRKNTKTPEAVKLASKIASYLFEQECGEMKYMKDSEKELLRKANRMLLRVDKRVSK